MSTIQTTFSGICCIDHRNHHNSMLNHHRVGAKAKKMKKRRKVCSSRDDDDFGEGKNIDMMEETKSEAAAMMAVAMMMMTTMTMVNDHNPFFVAFAETKFLPIPETSVPATASCGNFTKERLDIARAILVCNQEPGTKNWKQACLSHYSANVEYTDGPGLTHVVGRENMRQYLKNQFDFSRQWLSVTDEVCDGNKYVAEWNLSMDLGIGSFRDLPGVTVLKFMEDGSDLVKYHRDYLPDGNIVERQPVVGSLVKFQRETYARCMASKEGCVGLLGGPGK
jgi:hypothetical protein